MAKKKTQGWDIPETIEPVIIPDPVNEDIFPPVVVKMADMVRIINKKHQRKEVHLIDGRCLHLGKFHPQKNDHISSPIEKSLLPPAVFDMAKRGNLIIEEVK